MSLEIFFTLKFFGNSLIKVDIGSFLHIWWNLPVKLFLDLSYREYFDY